MACKKRYTSKDGGCLELIIKSISYFACFILIMIALIFGQIFYNKTENWENCGSIKGWIIYGLVINYIMMISTFIKFIITIVAFGKK